MNPLTNNMAFNSQAARDAGYTDEEINNYLNTKTVTQTAKSIPGPGETVLDMGRKVVGEAEKVADVLFPGLIPEVKSQYATARGAQQQFGQTGDYGQYLQNVGPLLNPFTLGKAKASSGVAAWALPGGQGANLGRTLLAKGATGVVRGGLYGFSQEDATPQSVGASAVAGGTLEPALGLISILASKASPVGGKIFKVGKQMLGGKQKAAQATTRAVEKYTGEQPMLDPIKEKILAIPQKMASGQRREATEIVNRVISDIEKPLIQQQHVSSTIPDYKFPVQDILGERRAMSGFISQEGKGLENAVNKQVQRVLTQELHRLVPETLTPDLAYRNLAVADEFFKRYGKWLGFGALTLAANRLINAIFNFGK